MSFKPSRILINGRFVNSEYSVSIFSPSFQYGLNVFEGIRAYVQEKGGLKVFMLSEHCKRLIKSSELLGFNTNLTKEIIEKDINFLLNTENPSEDIYIKYMLCFLEKGNWSKVDNIDRVVFFYPVKSNLCESISSKANFSSFKRISNNSLLPQIKCGANYINSRMAYLETVRFGFDFPLLINENGFVSESSGACIFIIKDGVLSTPASYSHILGSITRNAIIDLVKNNKNIPIKDISETQITRFDVLSADEVFLVGTNVEIRIISEIDNVKFKSEIVHKIINQFKNLVRSLR